jgi:hypothetical protein
MEPTTISKIENATYVEQRVVYDGFVEEHDIITALFTGLLDVMA